MTVKIALCFCCVMFVAVSDSHAQSKRLFKSPSVNSAWAAYERTIQDAIRTNNQKIEGALRRFESKAKDAIKFSTMNGDLDEALRLKNFLQLVRKVRGTLDIQLIQKKALEAAYRKNLVGTWVTRTGGRNDRRVYKISETGDVTMSVQPDGKTYRGKVVVRGDSVFIDFGDRDNDRVTVIGDRFFLQHWRGDVKGFPDAVQSGYRLKEQKK
ncbi:MAG: hypothetical protein Tsb009_36250 [Planctomycetaceae bacterium]